MGIDHLSFRAKFLVQGILIITQFLNESAHCPQLILVTFADLCIDERALAYPQFRYQNQIYLLPGNTGYCLCHVVFISFSFSSGDAKKKIKNKEFTLFPPCKFSPPISSTLIFKFQQILALHLQRFSLTEQGMLSGILLHPGSPTQCKLSCFYLIQRPADICFKALHSQSAS